MGFLQGINQWLNTQPKTGDTNCHKIDDGNPNNLANTEIYAYSETTFGGLLYTML